MNEKRRPDLDKLRAFADELDAISVPVISSETMELAADIADIVDAAIDKIRQLIEEAKNVRTD